MPASSPFVNPVAAAVVVVDDGVVQLSDPAVRAKLEHAPEPEPGSDVRVRLERADPAERTVAFTLAAG